MALLRNFLRGQYLRTMEHAYRHARSAAKAGNGTRVLDCGCGDGAELELTFSSGSDIQYTGLEWSASEVEKGRREGREVLQADLNRPLPLADGSKDRVLALSVLEHLLMPSAFLGECHRVLAPGGRLVILTPNISTYFTALQILAGRMPSSGPHPDSNWLLDREQGPAFGDRGRDDLSSATPQHRHLVVFSFSSLARLLDGIGFDVVDARGFGWYPLPGWMQTPFERMDPWHCHQMVFVCERRG